MAKITKPTDFIDFLPKNHVAESRVLGCVILEQESGEDNQVLDAFLEMIGKKTVDEFFTLDIHMDVADAIIRLAGNGHSINTPMVMEECGGESDGLADMVEEMKDRIESFKAFPDYVKKICQLAEARKIARLGLEMADRVISSRDSEKALIAAQSEILAIQAYNSSEKGETTAQIIENIKSKVRIRRGETKDTTGILKEISSDIEAFDKKMTPFRLGQDAYVAVAARPSIGKTSWISQIIQNLLIKDPEAVVVDFQVENSKENHLSQMAARFVDINLERIEEAEPERVERYFKALDWFKETCEERLFVFAEAEDRYIETMERKLRAVYAKKKKITAICYDYIQLMESYSFKAGTNPNVVVKSISSKIKPISKSVGGAVSFVLSQLDRSVEKEKRRPRMSDLKWAGEIEQDADRIEFIYRLYNEKDVIDKEIGLQRRYIYQAKNRNGSVSDIQCGFMKNFRRFCDIETTFEQEELI